MTTFIGLILPIFIPFMFFSISVMDLAPKCFLHWFCSSDASERETTNLLHQKITQSCGKALDTLVSFSIDCYLSRDNKRVVWPYGQQADITEGSDKINPSSKYKSVRILYSSGNLNHMPPR